MKENIISLKFKGVKNERNKKNVKRVSGTDLDILCENINKYTETGDWSLIELYHPYKDSQTGYLVFDALLSKSI